jgi:hypothetical protein
MKRSDGMRLLQDMEGAFVRRAAAEKQGLVGHVFDMVRGWNGRRETHQRQMQLVETLGLGGKRQLMLVDCGGERFLVGGGLEGVQTIVRIEANASSRFIANLDETCQ